MSATSLLKFANEQQDDQGNPVQWGRAAEDGFPFRGKSRLHKTEDEYDANVSRVCDFKFKKFNLNDEKDAAEYQQVMDRIVNSWYRMFFIDREGLKNNPPTIYVEWGQYYMQESATAERKPVAAQPQFPTMGGAGDVDQ